MAVSAGDHWRDTVRKPGHALAAMLACLQLALVAGFDGWAGRMLLTAHLGAFLLWQPMVSANRRLDVMPLVLLLAGLVAFQWALGWVSLSVWLCMLAGLVVAQAASRSARRDRLPDLLGFGYLVLVLLAWVVPLGVPLDPDVRRLLERLARDSGYVVVVLVALAALTKRRQRAGALPDFAAAATAMLAVGVIVLTALAFMFLTGASYERALLQSVGSVAVVLLMLGWLWNPRGGYSGVALLLSRRALAGSLPLEEWLGEVSEEARNAPSATAFLAAAASRMLELPGVTGVAWHAEPGLDGSVGRLGRHTNRIAHGDLVVTIGTRGTADAVTLWRWDLMVNILAEFLVSRRQAADLAEIGYLRAIHETGARLTHDVKNLLQSFEAILYAAESGFARDPEGTQALIQRQLPTLAARLRLTLDKLRQPGPDASESIMLPDWWARLQARLHDVACVGSPDPMLSVPAGLFDRFVDNCVQNARDKADSRGRPTIAVHLCGDGRGFALEVRDDGMAVPPERATRLMREPVASDAGLGVGLMQLAREAALLGWRVRLAENRDGGVCFRLDRPQAGDTTR
ncbi:ATP-binding protein [Niveibacterium sp.]|uniref:ATP-binding protein n=1 Tax=Niveibacterium sp. TaxID=2017444 RepID=UPI0035B467DA